MTVSVSGGRNVKAQLRKMRDSLMGAPKVLVGVPRGAGSYKDGTNIATIAAVNEFGSEDGTIPERSAIRDGVAQAEPQIKKLYEKKASDVINGDMDVKQLQGLVGELAVGSIVGLIESGVSPANAQSTIDRKGSSKPLIDTGAYRQSITYRLSDKGEDIEEGL